MAHFAQLDENNVVIQVVVINNGEIIDENGLESEAKGIKFCEDHFGGRWIQTSYNGSFRKQYGSVGCRYDPVKDEFLPPAIDEKINESLIPLIGKVDDDVQKQRWNTCVSCDKFYAPMAMCKECGCFMKIKTYLPKVQCPIGKW